MVEQQQQSLLLNLFENKLSMDFGLKVPYDNRYPSSLHVVPLEN